MNRIVIVSNQEAKRLEVACRLRQDSCRENHSNRQAGMWRKLAERFAPTARPLARIRRKARK